MKVICYLFLLIGIAASAQQRKDSWTSFYDDSEMNLRGFKDASGKIMLEPKYIGATVAFVFDDVIAVMEEDYSETYYLLKNGKKFGRDSLYYSDMSFDCESEGFIKFQVNDKVGMFDKNGKPVIPAEYNDLTSFRNGMSSGLKDAVKTKMDDGHSGCDHWYWSGGTQNLINTKNEVLADNFTYSPNLDFYSMQRLAEPSKDTCRVNFKGRNGKYYSFIDNEKLFKKFLHDEVLGKPNEKALSAASYRDIVYYDATEGWKAEPAAKFIARNKREIFDTLKNVKPGADYYIMNNIYVPLPDNMESDFEKYKDNCGQQDYMRHPIMSLIINYRTPDDIQQDSFDFIKTENGYKLLSVNLKSQRN